MFLCIEVLGKPDSSSFEILFLHLRYLIEYTCMYQMIKKWIISEHHSISCAIALRNNYIVDEYSESTYTWHYSFLCKLMSPLHAVYWLP